ncbi:MAG: efflux RND transporter periplasmic adaptor subunit [Acidobacteriota bacterium]
MRLKTLLPIAVVLLAVLGAFVLLATRETVTPVPAERPLPSVRVLTVEPTSLELSVTSQGTVLPRTESQIVPEVAGAVVWTSPALASGGYFEAGELLVRIDPARYRTAVDRAEASVSRAQGELEYAHAMLRRQERLASEEIASVNMVDDAQRQVSVTEANVRDAQAALEEARRDSERTEIRAPFRGRVRSETVDVGQFVTVGAPIATLYATDYLEVRLPIADDELAFLEIPLWDEPNEQLPSVRLHTRFAGKSRSWPARVVRTEGEIDTQSRMVHVIARVENPRRPEGDQIPLPVGLFVQAEIEAQVAQDVFVLPRAALDGEQAVTLIDEEDRLRRRVVEVLRTERDRVIVVSGLASGDRICAVAPANFVEGAHVQTYGDEATESATPASLTGATLP